MVQAMRRRVWWYRGLVYLTLASLVWGQTVWPISSLFWQGSSDGPPASAQAAVLTWDADTMTSGAQDGAGTWNTTNMNWWDPTLGMNVSWNNSTPDSAVIGAGTGTGSGTYTITLGSNITVGGTTAIQFNNPNASGGTRGYEIAGGGYTLTLNAPTINVNYTTPSGAPHPTISAPIAGTAGLTKTGSGTLVLSGTNTYSGGTTISGGILSGSSIANQGSNSSFGTGNFTLSGGGTFQYTGTSNVSTDRTFSFGTGGGKIHLTSPITFTISGALSGSGDLSTVAPSSGTSTLILSGNNSSYTGIIRPATNTLVQINSASALGGAGVVLAGGTARIYGASTTVQNPGVNGLNAYYYNVGFNSDSMMSSVDNRFATELLIIPDRVIQRIDTHPMTLNLPVAVNTDYPRVPVVGFQVPDRLAMMWKGLVNITTGGTYTFWAAHDDRFSLYIDGQAVLPESGSPSSGRSASIYLSPGAHSIVIKFTQGGGGKYLVVQYSGPDTGNNYQILGSTSGVLTTGALAPVPIGQVGGSGTLEIYSDMVASGFTGSGTFTLTSPTISTLTINGAGTLTAATTLAPTSGALIFKQGISGGYALTVAGPYLTRFEATNSYTGTTTVTGGRLELAASGGNAIPGSLDINAGNTAGLVANVQLKADNQIADTATVTVRYNSLLDLGSYSDTIYRLSMQAAGQIWGTGTLTVTDLTNSTFQSGRILANLAGSGTLQKTSTGTLILAGNNTYTGQTVVQAGVLNIRHGNALGATGSGNDTVVSSGATLELQGGINVAGEAIRVTGTGQVWSGVNLGALRNVSGTNRLGQTLTLNGDTFIRSESGNLILANSASIASSTPSNLTIDGNGEVTIRGSWDLSGGTLTKQGRGTLTFDQSLSSFPSVNWVSGVIGFNGPQSWGTYAVGAGKALKFYSDPGAGVNIQLYQSAVIAGYAADQALLSRIDAFNSPSGALLLGVDSSNALNFTGHPTIVLGAFGSAAAPGGRIRYTGTLTPGAGGYLLGAPTGDPSNILEVASVLSGTANMGIYGPVWLSANNTFSGTINVDGPEARLMNVMNNSQLGDPSNVVVLTNGGTLHLVMNARSADALFGHLGNPLAGGIRQIQVGTGGGVLHVSTPVGTLQERFILSGTNPITGSGTLTKTGQGYLEIETSADFSGALVLAGQGGGVELRASGALPNVASITVGQNAYFIVDNQNGRGSRQFPSVNNNNRVNDSASITLQGGFLYYRPRNASGQTSETFGTVTIGQGHSMIRLEPQGQGADVTITNLVHNPASAGGGTVRLETSGGTFGSSGNNPRLFFTQINGATPSTTNLIGGWAFLSNYHWAGYDTTAGVGVKQSSYTDVGATTFTPTSTQIINLNASGTATLSDATGDVHEMLALRFGANASQTLAFADPTNDILYIYSGGILSDNVNQARAISTSGSGTRGRITAGAPNATGAQDLFFHINQNQIDVYATIIDNNPNAPVAVVKDLGGILNLRVANTYTGGTYIYGGELGAYATGALGTGPVLIKAGMLRQNASGVTTSTAGIEARDGGVIYLDNNGVTYNAAGDRYIVRSGSVLFGHANTTDKSLSGLTRVSAFSGGGQVILEPGAIVAIHNDSTYAGDLMTYMIKNLGTDADLFFCQQWGASPLGSPLQSLTVGAGTPWKGISSVDGNYGWYQGTIYANSDFWLQGVYRGGSSQTLALGRPSTSNPNTGSYAIINQAGRPINVYVVGTVALNEDTPVQMSGDITFVVTSEGYLQPLYANSFGDLERFGSRAKVLVQAGGTLDPGNYTPIYPYQDSPDYPAYYGKQYPLPSPVNTDVVVEAGGRFLINDASGVGSTTGGAKWIMKTGSILELGTANAFFGSHGYDPNNPSANTGLIAPGQFVFEPYVIFRLAASSVYKLSDYIPNDPVIYEVFGGSREMTNFNNPFIPVAPGTVTIAPEDYRIRGGDILTNDSVDRYVNAGRARLILEDGAILLGTTQTALCLSEDLVIPAGATVYIASRDVWIDGNPKKGGAVWLTALHSNHLIDPGATVWIEDGAQLGLANRNCWPDTLPIHLPYAVSTWTPTGGSAAMPGNGSTLMLRTSGWTEVIGPLTGSGGVLTDQSSAWLATGWGATSDFTFAGVFSGTGGQQPNLQKIGPTRMDLTGTSTSTGEMLVNQGTLALSGPAGKTDFATVRVGKTGRLLLDNSSYAVNNRLGATAARNVSGQGGVLELLGNNSTAVTETINQLNNSGSPVGSKTVLQVTPGSATTTFVATTIQTYVDSGGRSTTWVFRTPAMANQPIVYNADNTYTVPGGNLTNGLIRATNPNFWISSGIDQPGRVPASGQIIGIAGAGGTPVAPSRGDILGVHPTTGQIGFVTQDVNNDSNVGFRLLTDGEYAPYFRPNMTTNLNVRLPAGTFTATGDTRFRLLRMSPGAVLDITGVVPLTNSPSRVYLYGSGVLVDSGGTATIRGTYLQSYGGPLYLHTYGDLRMEATPFVYNTLVKTGPGTLTFAPGTAKAWRGSLVVDEGAVVFQPGNTFRPWPSQHRWYAQSLYLNGGQVDLGGNSQMIGDFQSVNWLPYGAAAGGTLTSSSPATLTITGGGTFSGQITGPISIVKYGNTTLTLTNQNPMTGSLTIRQGTVALRDEGRLLNLTGPIEVQYGRLDIDNAYLAGPYDRLPNNVNILMRGGDIVHRGRAGQLTQLRLGQVTLEAGTNLFQTEAGGSGASETYIQNLVRSADSYAVVDFRQNWGFIGTPGNDTTAIRYFIQNVNGSPLTLTNNILGGWAIAADEHFATYRPGQGISWLGNTADGFPDYDSTNLLTATATQNVNDGTARTLTGNVTINALRFNGDVTHNLAGYTLTVNSGGVISNRGGGHGFTGGAITSGTDALYIWVNQGTMSMGSKITGSIALVKAGRGTLSLNAANDYTGPTYALAGTDGASTPSGTLSLNVSGANGSTTVAIPGDLYIHHTTVTEAQANQIKNTATVYLYGGSTFNLVDSAGVTETLGALVFRNSGGDAEARPIVTRSSQRISYLNLTAPRAIDAVTDNPVSVPAISQNVGLVNFTGSSPQEIYVAGSSPINFIFNAGIGSVPTGGIKKTGPGMLHLGGNVGSTFAIDHDGNPGTPPQPPTTLTDLFFIEEGIVRVDTTGGTATGAPAINNKIGSNKVNTVVRSGAGLLGRNASTNPIYGSIRLEDGSFLGTTEGDSVFGQGTTDTGLLAQLEVRSGHTATIYVRDYYLPYDYARTITINSKLTGGGTIQVVGPMMTTSPVGILRLGNNILGTTGGGNDFSGQIVLNPNTRLLAQTTGSARTGNLLGNATIVLNGGELYLRDNGTASNQTITYGNNVVLQGPSIINADRYDGSNTSNAIALGQLYVAAGEQVLQTPWTTSTFTWVNNGYRIAFSEIAGPGTLVKAGHQPLAINGYAADFSGNFVVAGPIGLSVQPSGNLRLNAATNTINNLTVGGIFSPVADKTLTVNGVLEVADNAGQVVNGTYGVSTGSVTGAMSVPNTATLTVNILRNNGIIGATGGATTITVTGQIQGSGLYQTWGQPLTLQGSSGAPVPLADAPDRPTTFKVAGNNTVTLNPASGSTMTGGVEVQSGTLRVAPSAPATNPFGTSTIKVLGYETPVVASPTAATLQLVGTQPITHGGNIQNSGLVQITGTVTVQGTISGPGPGAFVPGLLESFTTASGVWNSSSPQGTGNFGVKLEPRMGNMNVVTQNPITGWDANHTWIYTGLFYDADGYFSFIENIDDNTYILIDGVPRLSNNAWDVVTSTAMTVGQRENTIYANQNTAGGTLYFGNPDPDGNPNNGPEGWHTIEIRFNNGTGGAGPLATTWPNGFANNFGFGLNTAGTRALDGALYTRPIDPGNGTLFRVPIAAKGRIEVAAGASLTAGSISQTAQLTLAAGTSSLTLGQPSDVDVLLAQAGIAQIAGGTLTVNTTLSSGAGDSSFTKTGAGTLILGPNGTDTYTGPTTVLAGKLLVDGLITSNVTVTGGQLGGTGTVQGNVLVQTGGSASAGNLADPTGKLTILGTYTQLGTMQIDIQGGAQGQTYDWIAATGTGSVQGTLQIILDGYQPASLQTFDVLTAPTIVQTGPITIDDALAPLLPAQYWTYRILGDPGSGMILQLQVGVPEPASLVLALLGVLTLAGYTFLRRRKG
jgi:autotransporter-associated beta strand protein